MSTVYADEHVTLLHGDCRDLLPGMTADAIVTDPPYGETSLEWDRWLTGWPTLCAPVARSLWSFGSMRMFGQHWGAFTTAGWIFAQDIVWEKHNGSGFATDRFKRVHECATHWYRGRWGDVHHVTPRHPTTKNIKNRFGRKVNPEHTGTIGNCDYVDDGFRLARSVIYARSMHGRAIHPTEKPVAVLAQLIEYGVPLGGLVIDPFAGSGSTLLAARLTGRRAVGIEAREDYAEAAAARLAVPDLFGAVS